MLKRLAQWLKLFVLTTWPNSQRAAIWVTVPFKLTIAPYEQEPQQGRREAIPQAQQAAPAPAAPDPSPADPPSVASQADVAATPAPPVIPQLNRHERRRLEKWERERRKHDVLVNPAIPNEIPPKKPRVKKDDAPKPKPVVTEPIPEVPEARFLINGEDGKIYHERELWGEFTFRDTILEQLELYWIYLRRMKQREPDTYGFYKRVGATIVPPIHWFIHDGIREKKDEDEDDSWRRKPVELTPWWKENRPAFGCVTYGITKKIEDDERTWKPRKGHDTWVPKFFYFVKYDRPPPTVQPMSGGDIYKLTIWWDKPFDPKYNYKKGGIPNEYAVFLDRDHIQVLRMCETKEITIQHKKSGVHQQRGQKFSIPQRAWRIPECYTSWAEEKKESTEHFLARMFMDAARTFEQTNYGMVRVAVHNGDLTAQFVVDPRRMSYFFRDRDIVYTPNGAREAVFHIVRAHMRHTKTGAHAVRLHFKGAKEFTWAGYRVTVTVPVRDHLALTEFDVGVSDDYWLTPKERRSDGVREPEIGEMLVRLIDGRKALGDATDWEDIRREVREHP